MTAAFAAPNIKLDPVYVACDRQGSFFQKAAAMIDELVGRMDKSSEDKSTTKISILARVLGCEKGHEKTAYIQSSTHDRVLFKRLKQLPKESRRLP